MGTLIVTELSMFEMCPAPNPQSTTPRLREPSHPAGHNMVSVSTEMPTGWVDILNMIMVGQIMCLVASVHQSHV